MTVSNPPWTLRLALLAIAMCLLMMAVGGLVHVQGGTLACPEWPLCEGTAHPVMEGRMLVEFGHRWVANFLAVSMLSLAGVLAWRLPMGRLRKLGLMGVVAVLAQGAVLSRAGVLLSIHRRTGEHVGREPEVLALVALLMALGVLALAAWLTRRSGDRLAAMGLLACELVELTSSFGAAMVFLERPPLVVVGHGLASTALIVVLALVATGLWRERAPTLAPAGVGRASGVLAAVVVVAALGFALRHGGPAVLYVVHPAVAAVVAPAGVGLLWALARSKRPVSAPLARLAIGLLLVELLLGLIMLYAGYSPVSRTLHQVAGTATLALLAALALSQGGTRAARYGSP